MTDPRRYCPQCAQPLAREERGGRARLVCLDAACGFVFWDNPAPVVAAIVEYGDDVVLVRNQGWPEHWYGLVTGFLEPGETPGDAVLREVREEVGLDAQLGELIGLYPFFRMNQIIIAYHVIAGPGEIRIDPIEIAAYRCVPIAQVQPWEAGTGLALRDWLRTRGYERELVPLRRA
ncbi:MAG: NUDIX domain-containing protein [Gammaproteobacteria bacterium]|nr:NUDIX domain-containing protein [Gammaproteobacteria bacterium]